MATFVKRQNQKDHQQPLSMAYHEPTTLDELEGILRRGRDVMVAIAPAIAAQLKEKWNEGNRRLDEVTVQRYRRDMESNRWLRDGEIGFGVLADKPTSLGNGQHRMAAQVASGTTQSYHARVFSDPDEFALYVLTVDGGKNRTLADELRIFGIADNSQSAQRYERTVNAMHAFVGARSCRLSKPERFDFALRYQKSVKYALGLPNKTFKAHLLAAIALAHTKRRSEVEDLIAHVISGEMLQAGPALTIMKALPDFNEARKGSQKDRAMGLLLRAIYDGVRGKQRTSVEHVKSDSVPMREAITALVSSEAADGWIKRMENAKRVTT